MENIFVGNLNSLFKRKEQLLFNPIGELGLTIRLWTNPINLGVNKKCAVTSLAVSMALGSLLKGTDERKVFVDARQFFNIV